MRAANPVLKMGNEITYGFNGRFAFPSLPTSLIPKPTLVWLVDSKKAKQKVEVTYLTQNINWRADYVMVIDAKDKQGRAQRLGHAHQQQRRDL